MTGGEESLKVVDLRMTLKSLTDDERELQERQRRSPQKSCMKIRKSTKCNSSFFHKHGGFSSNKITISSSNAILQIMRSAWNASIDPMESYT
jgi:hypothetical protein